MRAVYKGLSFRAILRLGFWVRLWGLYSVWIIVIDSLDQEHMAARIFLCLACACIYIYICNTWQSHSLLHGFIKIYDDHSGSSTFWRRRRLLCCSLRCCLRFGSLCLWSSFREMRPGFRAEGAGKKKYKGTTPSTSDWLVGSGGAFM